jgi:hypothetical protein
MCSFRMTEYLIKKHPVPTKRATINLITVKSRNALLRVLLVCIRSYLISVVRYKFLILDTCHPDTLYLREQGREDPRLFFETKRGPRAKKKKSGKHCFKGFISLQNVKEILELVCILVAHLVDTVPDTPTTDIRFIS